MDTAAVYDSVLSATLSELGAEGFTYGFSLFFFCAVGTLSICIVIRLINRGAGH